MRLEVRRTVTFWRRIAASASRSSSPARTRRCSRELAEEARDRLDDPGPARYVLRATRSGTQEVHVSSTASWRARYGIALEQPADVDRAHVPRPPAPQVPRRRRRARDAPDARRARGREPRAAAQPAASAAGRQDDSARVAWRTSRGPGPERHPARQPRDRASGSARATRRATREEYIAEGHAIADEGLEMPIRLRWTFGTVRSSAARRAQTEFLTNLVARAPPRLRGHGGPVRVGAPGGGAPRSRCRSRSRARRGRSTCTAPTSISRRRSGSCS